MNRSLQDIGGQLLLVSQFTLAADTRSGTRPGFSPAAPPEEGRRLFDYLVERARARLGAVQTGEFGANMQVSLTNDGPVTFWLQVRPTERVVTRAGSFHLRRHLSRCISAKCFWRMIRRLCEAGEDEWASVSKNF